MSEARRWLAEHASGAPLGLAAGMKHALSAAGVEEEPAAEALADAAMDALRRVVQGEGGRGSAVDLLAADALLTCACQAAAEGGPAAVEALTARLDVRRFEALLPGGGG